MNQILLLAGTVILICILTSRLTERLGVPSLLAFYCPGHVLRRGWDFQNSL